MQLHQEIWHPSVCHRVTFSSTEYGEFDVGEPYPANIFQVVSRNLEWGRGPVLVFTETRREAANLAQRFAQVCQVTIEGVQLRGKLALFSEPTESSEQLQDNVQRGVAFHTADLTPAERQIIEGAFLANEISVCFATSTLAAGVNFPFQTVVFPKLSYSFGDRQGVLIGTAEYRNMSGRAGRLGLHEAGYAVLLPSNSRELSHSRSIVLPENEFAVS